MCSHLVPPSLLCLCTPPQLCLCCHIILPPLYLCCAHKLYHPIHFIYQTPSYFFRLPYFISSISSTIVHHIPFIDHSPSHSYLPYLVISHLIHFIYKSPPLLHLPYLVILMLHCRSVLLSIRLRKIVLLKYILNYALN